MAINKGTWVAVQYAGTLSDGTVFDTSEGRESLTFEVGAGVVLPKFDEAVAAAEVGKETEFDIPATEAYGEYSDDRKETVPKTFFQGVDKIEIGMSFMAQSPMGPLKVKVLTLDGENATVSINHPLAGEDLHFKITVEKELSKEEVTARKELEAKAAEAAESAAKGGCGDGGCCSDDGEPKEGGCCSDEGCDSKEKKE
jgi:FKBP-type peptidyl-prolyl cis-trans isomerase 2